MTYNWNELLVRLKLFSASSFTEIVQHMQGSMAWTLAIENYLAALVNFIDWYNTGINKKKLPKLSSFICKLCFNSAFCSIENGILYTPQCEIKGYYVNINCVLQMLLGNLLRVSSNSLHIHEPCALTYLLFISTHLEKSNLPQTDFAKCITGNYRPIDFCSAV